MNGSGDTKSTEFFTYTTTNNKSIQLTSSEEYILPFESSGGPGRTNTRDGIMKETTFQVKYEEADEEAGIEAPRSKWGP